MIYKIENIDGKLFAIYSDVYDRETNKPTGEIRRTVNFLCPACGDRHTLGEDGSVLPQLPRIIRVNRFGNACMIVRCNPSLKDGMLFFGGDTNHSWAVMTKPLPDFDWKSWLKRVAESQSEPVEVEGWDEQPLPSRKELE